MYLYREKVDKPKIQWKFLKTSLKMFNRNFCRCIHNTTIKSLWEKCEITLHGNESLSQITFLLKSSRRSPEKALLLSKYWLFVQALHCGVNDLRFRFSPTLISILLWRCVCCGNRIWMNASESGQRINTMWKHRMAKTLIKIVVVLIKCLRNWKY